jgi:hypothetical protein
VRLFRIDGDGRFTEYGERDSRLEFQEKDLESWLEQNQGAIIEDGKLLIIGKQIQTNLNAYIDLLAVDKEGDIAVLELKRDRTPRETLAQAFEYISFAERLDYEELNSLFQSYFVDETTSLSEYHRKYFELGEEESVSFNKDQRIVIIGQEITPSIRETAKYFRKKGFKVSCIEFTFFKMETGEELLSTEIVVGLEPQEKSGISSASLPKVDKDVFLESVSVFGRPLFEALLASAESNGWPIHWGTKGFSVNIDMKGNHVALCICYPPGSVFRESIYMTIEAWERKVANSDEIISKISKECIEMGFERAGNRLKYSVTNKVNQEMINRITRVLKNLASSLINSAMIE